MKTNEIKRIRIYNHLTEVEAEIDLTHTACVRWGTSLETVKRMLREGSGGDGKVTVDVKAIEDKTPFVRKGYETKISGKESVYHLNTATMAKTLSLLSGVVHALNKLSPNGYSVDGIKVRRLTDPELPWGNYKELIKPLYFWKIDVIMNDTIVSVTSIGKLKIHLNSLGVKVNHDYLTAFLHLGLTELTGSIILKVDYK